MPTLLPALSQYVRRLARREIRAETAHTKRASAQHRRDIAALKRTIKGLTDRLSGLERQKGNAPALPTTDTATEGLRFRADGFKTLRAKLGLSAKDMGKLIGVSVLTVYNWESGKSKPRRKQLPAIAAVRGLGKKEALLRLKTMK